MIVHACLAEGGLAEGGQAHLSINSSCSTQSNISWHSDFSLSAPEAAPTTLVVHNITSTSISVSWEAPSTELQNGVIRHYQIVAFEVDTNTTITYRATANTAFTVGELHPYYTYQVAVQAVTVATGPLSDPVSVLTLQDGEFESMERHQPSLIKFHKLSFIIVPFSAQWSSSQHSGSCYQLNNTVSDLGWSVK